jgi:YVTN family beta-propeller protein
MRRSTDASHVGPQADGRHVVPTNQVLWPAGTQVDLSGRPTDIDLSPDGRFLAVLNRNNVLILDADEGKVLQTLNYKTKGGGSYTGMLFSQDGRTLYASNIGGRVEVFRMDASGRWQAADPIVLGKGGNALPAGMALSLDGQRLYVALNHVNALVEVDVAGRKVIRQIAVGSAPYDVVLAAGKAYVSNWGGRLPEAGDVVGPAGRSTPPVKVDPVRHIACEGSVSVVDLASWRCVDELIVGMHASGMAASPDGRYVFVANANSDTVSVIDTACDRAVETIPVRPRTGLLFGSAPNAMVAGADGRTLYVSNGTNNAIAVIQLGRRCAPWKGGEIDRSLPPDSRLLGFIPTGWYPAGIVLDRRRNRLCVANVKGIGSRDRKREYGFSSHDHRGTVSLIPLPDPATLDRYTRIVMENNRMTETISALAPARKDARPRVVPGRHGEPSLIRHVLYVIKENRTYDQVFGDMPQGNGEPNLCHFGRRVTPNHHKLAETYTLFDNFYCSGVLSADGHQWTDEAYVTDYLEKSFAGFVRSYPYDGDDALAYASSGFIWDNVLAHGKTLRVYGEFVKATIHWKDPARRDRPAFLDCYKDFLQQTGLIEIRATAAIRTLEPYLCSTFIGFPNIVTDLYRANEFIKELRRFEAAGNLPNFMIMLLPNDHTVGTTPGRPTPRACVADNDLALGRIVEAVSRSRFWKDTCIFVVEDDPQNGLDHVDGHRTVAMVISPYTRRRFVDHTNYNQTSMVRTMELILGLPPMNQLDSSATPMTTCFTDRPNLESYQAVPNLILLDEMNPKLSEITDPRQRYWAQKSLEMPLEDVDQADEHTLNQILWHSVKGYDTPYPSVARAETDSDEDDDN